MEWTRSTLRKREIVKWLLAFGFWLLVLKIEKGGKKTFLHLCGRIFMFDIFRDATTVQPMCGLPA
jgi:hypothetical protein